MKLFTKECLNDLLHESRLSDLFDSFEIDSCFYYECPFCGEYKLQIDETDTRYHCFECDAHGDCISFLMNFNRMNFSDAVEAAAKMYNIHLDEYDEVPEECKEKVDIPKELIGLFTEFVDDPEIVSTILLNYIDRKKSELRRKKEFKVV